MALPANVTTTTVTGNLVWIDGSPAKGSVTFLPSIEYVLDPADDTSIYMYEVTEVLDADGHFELDLIATDQADINPVDWTYTVRILLTDPSAPSNQHKPVETIFSMYLPSAPPINIADVTPVQSSPGNAVVVGPAGLPGQVVSVNGKQGAVVLTANDVGAEPLGATASMQAALNAHIVDPSDAHDASAVSFLPVGTIVATNVQAAIAEDALDLANHIGSVGIVHAAGAVSFAPTGNFSSTNVQSAITEDAADLAAHLVDAIDAHDASAISVAPGGSISATTVQAALAEIAADAAGALTLHINTAVDAHDAAAISVVPSGTIASTNVQAALNEVATEAATGSTAVQTNLTAHINDAVDAHDATAVSFAPGGGIAATTVQAAILEDAADLSAHLSDAFAAHAASAVSFSPTAGIAATTVQAAIVEDAGDLAAHLADASDAHDASAISYMPSGTIVANTVQGAIAEAAAEAVSATATVATNLANHINDTTDAHDASAVSFVPTGSIQANNVQAAIVEAINESVGSAGLIADHINDPSGAHAATAVSFAPTDSIVATNAQAAVVAVSDSVAAVSSGLAAHIANTTDAHDAAAVSFNPGAGVAATDVQAAVYEVSGDVSALSALLGDHLTDTTAVHLATAISIVPLGAITSSDVQAAIYQISNEAALATAAVDQRVSDHINDTTDAHDASAISVLDTGGLFTATDVEAAFIENRTIYNGHVALTTTAHGGLVPPTRALTTTAPLTGGGDLSANRTLAVSAATEAAVGVVELASTGEATAGTDIIRAVTAAGVKAAIDARGYLTQATADPRYVQLSGATEMTGALDIKAPVMQLSIDSPPGTGSWVLIAAEGVNKGQFTATKTGDFRVASYDSTTKLILGNSGNNMLEFSGGNLVTVNNPIVSQAGAPSAVSHLTRKDYVDAQVATRLTQAAADALYINTAGDTMTGVLRMPMQGGIGGQIIGTDGADVEQGSIRIGTTEANLKHLTQVSLITAAAQRLVVTTTGITSYLPITLQADPVNPLQVATKQYVDGRPDVPTSRTISTTAPLTGGGALTGNLSLTVAAATATATGVVELATTAEATAAVDTVRAVTPAGLADRVPVGRTLTTTAPLSGGGDLSINRTISITSATESLIGAVELATQAEVDAGVDDARAVTPLKLKTSTKVQPLNVQPGTAYTLIPQDAAYFLIATNAAPFVLTVPNNASAAVPIGSFIDLMRHGAGTFTVTPQAPAVVRGTSTTLRAQYSTARLVKIGTDEWSLAGDLT